jgi:hypothetical protein
MKWGAIEGRPDFEDRGFGKTYLKRFPPYVYSLLGGMLVHKVLNVEAQWYQAARSKARPGGTCLERLASPRLTIHTVCGYSFYAGREFKRKRSQSCAVPKPGAVLCGRCHGTGPVFGKGLAVRETRREDARSRIGCAAEVP